MMLMIILTISSMAITKNTDGSLTLSATEAIELTNKIKTLQAELEKSEAIIAKLEETLEQERAMFKLNPKLPIEDKLLWFILGSGTMVSISYLLGVQ